MLVIKKRKAHCHVILYEGMFDVFKSDINSALVNPLATLRGASFFTRYEREKTAVKVLME